MEVSTGATALRMPAGSRERPKKMAGTEMPKTYAATVERIAELQEHAAKLRQDELETVLADVRAKVAQYGLTEQDVFGRKRKARQSAPSGSVQTSVQKYRDPKTGATWSGKGRAPSWIAGAKSRKRFEIAAA